MVKNIIVLRKNAYFPRIEKKKKNKSRAKRYRDARVIMRGNYIFCRRTLMRGTLPGYPLAERSR